MEIRQLLWNIGILWRLTFPSFFTGGSFCLKLSIIYQRYQYARETLCWRVTSQWWRYTSKIEIEKQWITKETIWILLRANLKTKRFQIFILQLHLNLFLWEFLLLYDQMLLEEKCSMSSKDRELWQIQACLAETSQGVRHIVNHIYESSN